MYASLFCAAVHRSHVAVAFSSSQRVLLGAAGTGVRAGQAQPCPWHGQPWSLVEELALQVSPGWWRESHLHVGLLFSPYIFQFGRSSCVRAAQGVRCDIHRLSSWPVGHLLDWIAEMPVYTCRLELLAEFGPEYSEVLLKAAPAPGAKQ